MYLMRLDDAAPNWDAEKWDKMHNLLCKYNVKPIFAIIPHNEDEKLMKYPEDKEFLAKIHSWISNGWTPALHGYSHTLIENCGGINPVNNRSEFAGASLEIQKQKIKDGYSLLKEWGIIPEIFVAPAHTFDKNTLLALYKESNIRIISDTVANDIYFKDEFFYIPQQSGQVRKLNHKITTFCYHPNTTTDAQFERLEEFLKLHNKEFISFDDIKFIKRKRSLFDILLSKLYFFRRKLTKIIRR